MGGHLHRPQPFLLVAVEVGRRRIARLLPGLEPRRVKRRVPRLTVRDVQVGPLAP